MFLTTPTIMSRKYFFFLYFVNLLDFSLFGEGGRKGGGPVNKGATNFFGGGGEGGLSKGEQPTELLSNPQHQEEGELKADAV